MTYVPSYLVNVERNFIGWPSDLKAEECELLVLMVRQALKAYSGTATLSEVHDYSMRDSVKRIYKQCCPVYYRAAVWDFKYACLDRALRNSGAYQTWTLDNCGEEDREPIGLLVLKIADTLRRLEKAGFTFGEALQLAQDEHDPTANEMALAVAKAESLGPL